MLEKRNILAIVVTYHPDGSFAERFDRLVGQVGAVLIVDNGSAPAAVSMLREAATHLSLALILTHANLGLAAAANIGVAQPLARGYGCPPLSDHGTAPG